MAHFPLKVNNYTSNVVVIHHWRRLRALVRTEVSVSVWAAAIMDSNCITYKYTRTHAHSWFSGVVLMVLHVD